MGSAFDVKIHVHDLFDGLGIVGDVGIDVDGVLDDGAGYGEIHHVHGLVRAHHGGNGPFFLKMVGEAAAQKLGWGHRLGREEWTMKCAYITFRSITYAQCGERLVSRMGVRCSLQRTPRWMEQQGCGYALRIWAEDPQQVAQHLRENQIPLRRVWLQTQSGNLEELGL